MGRDGVHIFVAVYADSSCIPNILTLGQSLGTIRSQCPLCLLAASRLSSADLARVGNRNVRILFSTPVAPKTCMHRRGRVGKSPG